MLFYTLQNKKADRLTMPNLQRYQTDRMPKPPSSLNGSPPLATEPLNIGGQRSKQCEQPVSNSGDSRANSDSNANRKPRRIVCAALRHRQHASRIIASVHHGDPVAVNQMHPMENPGDFEVGFLDNRGVFLTRVEAAEVAVAAGQVGAGNTLLMSEEIY